MFKQIFIGAFLALCSTGFSQYVIDQTELANLNNPEAYNAENHSEERLDSILQVLQSDSSFSDELSRSMIAYPAYTLGYAWVDITVIPGARIHCEVVNMNGEIVQRRRINTDVHTVNLKDLPEGFYVIKVVKEGRYGLAFVHKGFEE